MEFDSCQADAYVDHLSNMPASAQCVAEADIYNEFGVLLVKKNTPIRRKNAALLGKHRLAQPVDKSVGLKFRLTDSVLLQLLGPLAQHWLQASSGDIESALRHVCLQSDFHPVLLQKLTVLQHSFAAAFNRSLYRALFTVMIAVEERWQHSKMEESFAAALFAELGLLHIDAEIVNRHLAAKTMQVAPDLRSAPLISSLILEEIGFYPEAVTRAVSEVFERPCGDGLPKARVFTRLSDYGQLISLADNIARRCVAPANTEPAVGELPKTFILVLPELRSLHGMFNAAIYHSAYVLIQKSTESPVFSTLISDPEAQRAHLFDRTLLICELFASAMSLSKAIEPLLKFAPIQRCADQIESALAVLHSSGFSHLDVVMILGEPESIDDMSAAELIELDFTQTNFFHLLQSSCLQLKRLLKKQPPNKTLIKILKLIEPMEATLKSNSLSTFVD